MLAPRMLGDEVRRAVVDGTGYVSYVSVEQDATGRALQRLLAVADTAGALRVGALQLTATQEATLDLFIEQTVGPYLGTAIQLAFELGTAAGLPAEAMVLELYQSGEMSRTFESFANAGFYRSVTAHGVTAQYGGFLRTLELDHEQLRNHFNAVLDDIRAGGFAAKLQQEGDDGYPTMRSIEGITAGTDPMSQAEDRVRRALRASCQLTSESRRSEVEPRFGTAGAPAPSPAASFRGGAPVRHGGRSSAFAGRYRVVQRWSPGSARRALQRLRRPLIAGRVVHRWSPGSARRALQRLRRPRQAVVQRWSPGSARRALQRLRRPRRSEVEPRFGTAGAPAPSPAASFRGGAPVRHGGRSSAFAGRIIDVSGLAPPRHAGQPATRVGDHHRAERANHARGRLEGSDSFDEHARRGGIEGVQHGDVQTASRSPTGASFRDAVERGGATERRAHRPHPPLAQLEHRLSTDPCAQAASGGRKPSAARQSGHIRHGRNQAHAVADEPGDVEDFIDAGALGSGAGGCHHDETLGPGGRPGVDDRDVSARLPGRQQRRRVRARHRRHDGEHHDRAVLGGGLDGLGEFAGRRRGSAARLIETSEEIAQCQLAVAIAVGADVQPQRNDRNAALLSDVGRQRRGTIGDDGDSHQPTAWS